MDWSEFTGSPDEVYNFIEESSNISRQEAEFMALALLLFYTRNSQEGGKFLLLKNSQMMEVKMTGIDIDEYGAKAKAKIDLTILPWWQQLLNLFA